MKVNNRISQRKDSGSRKVNKLFPVLQMLVAVSFLWPTGLFAERVIHRPPLGTVAGLPVRIEAALDNPTKYVWARLYVRRKTESIFTPLPMNGSGRYFRAEIPANYMIGPGTEYYIEARLNNGKKIFYPPAGSSAPQLLRNLPANTRIQIGIISPLPGIRINNPRPAIAATIRGLDALNRKERIIVRLDGQAVPAKIDFGFISYQPASNLPPGKHELHIEIYDERRTLVAERKVTFYIEPQLSPEEKIDVLKKDKAQGKQKTTDWETTGSIGFNYQAAQTQSKQDTSLANPDGYYVLQGQVQSVKNDTAVFVGPFTYSSQPNEGGTRINQYSAGARTGPWSTKWGTVSSQLSELTASGAGYLGVEGAYDEIGETGSAESLTGAAAADAGGQSAVPGQSEGGRSNTDISGLSDGSGGSMTAGDSLTSGGSMTPGGAQIQTGWIVKAFGGQTAMAVERNQDPNDLGVYSQHAYGGKVGYQFAPHWGYYSFQAVQNEDDADSISSAGFIPYGTNTATSVYARYELPKQWSLQTIEWELGYNENEIITPYLNATLDAKERREKTIGYGGYIKGSGKIKWLTTGYDWAYSRYSPGFITRFGSAAADTEAVSGGLNHTFFSGVLGVNESVEFSRDNLEQQKPTTTYTRGGTLGVSINPASWPSLSFSDTFQEQFTNDQSLRRVTNSFNGSSNIGWTLLTITQSLAVSFTQTDTLDFSAAAGPGNTTRSYAPVFSIQRNIPLLKVDLGLNGGYTLTESFDHKQGAGVQYDHSINDGINLSFTFGEGKYSLPLAFTHTRTFDDKSPHKVLSDTYNYSAGFTATVAENQTAGLTLGAAHFRDGISPAANYDQLSANINYNASF